MKDYLSKKYAVILLMGVFSASIPTVASADWVIKGLGFLGKDENGDNGSGATGINDFGQVVGNSSYGGLANTTHAFITGPNGEGMTDLGTVGGFTSTVAKGINNSGQVVGEVHTFTVGSDDRHAL